MKLAACTIFILLPLYGAAVTSSDVADWERFQLGGMRAFSHEDYAEAGAQFGRALAAAERLENDSSRLLASLNNLASAKTHMDAYSEAQRLFERARSVQVDDQAEPRAKELRLEIDISYAGLKLRQGERVAAEQQFERLLPEAEEMSGPWHASVARVLNHLATCAREAGRNQQARSYAQRALAIRERATGPESLEAATSLSVLSQIAQSQMEYATAEKLCRRALAIRQRILGPNQPSVGESLSNLGSVLNDEGKSKEAELLYRQAMRLWERKFGAASMQVAIAFNNLGKLYEGEGKWRKAEDQLSKSVQLMEQSVGPEHPNLARVLFNLGSLYRERHKIDEAERVFRRCLSIDEQKRGPIDQRTFADLTALGEVMGAKRNFPEAEALLTRALLIQEGLDGPRGDPAAQAAFRLALLYQVWGKPAAALPYYQRASSTWQAEGSASLSVAQALETYAQWSKQNEDFADAEHAIAQATGIRVRAARMGLRNAFPPSSPSEAIQAK